MPAIVSRELLPALSRWAGRDAARKHRVHANFGDRAAGTRSACSSASSSCMKPSSCPNSSAIVAARPAPGPQHGTELAADHRRIVATALGRLRGKLKYRPVVFELLPETFTLLQLQRTVEALTGMRLHKQNFRRLVENGRFLEATRGLERARKRPSRKAFPLPQRGRARPPLLI